MTDEQRESYEALERSIAHRKKMVSIFGAYIDSDSCVIPFIENYKCLIYRAYTKIKGLNLRIAYDDIKNSSRLQIYQVVLDYFNDRCNNWTVNPSINSFTPYKYVIASSYNEVMDSILYKFSLKTLEECALYVVENNSRWDEYGCKMNEIGKYLKEKLDSLKNDDEINNFVLSMWNVILEEGLVKRRKEFGTSARTFNVECKITTDVMEKIIEEREKDERYTIKNRKRAENVDLLKPKPKALSNDNAWGFKSSIEVIPAVNGKSIVGGSLRPLQYKYKS